MPSFVIEDVEECWGCQGHSNVDNSNGAREQIPFFEEAEKEKIPSSNNWRY